MHEINKHSVRKLFFLLCETWQQSGKSEERSLRKIENKSYSRETGLEVGGELFVPAPLLSSDELIVLPHNVSEFFS